MKLERKSWTVDSLFAPVSTKLFFTCPRYYFCQNRFFFAKESWVYSFLTLSEIVLVFWKKIFCRAVKTAIYVSIWRFRLKHRFFGNLITFLTFFWYLGKTSFGPLTKTFRQEIKTAFYASKELFLRDFFLTYWPFSSAWLSKYILRVKHFLERTFFGNYFIAWIFLKI